MIAILKIHKNLAKKLESQYEVPVLPTDCANLSIEDINSIFGKILYEFPIERLNIVFPKWVDGLCDDHWLKKELYSEIKDSFNNVKILKQVDGSIQNCKYRNISSTILNEVK